MIDWSQFYTQVIVAAGSLVSLALTALGGFGVNWLIKAAKQADAIRDEAHANRRLAVQRTSMSKSDRVKAIIHNAVKAIEQRWKGKAGTDPEGNMRKVEAAKLARYMLSCDGLWDNTMDNETLSILIDADVNDMPPTDHSKDVINSDVMEEPPDTPPLTGILHELPPGLPPMSTTEKE
jgi:hypothetical protein